MLYILIVLALLIKGIHALLAHALYTEIFLKPLNRPDSTVEETFDFIIVGSGSAGSVLANRLSENRKWRILLLEIGKEPSVFTEIPMATAYFLFTDYNWRYLTEKQENMALGLFNQRMHWPRGRVLGGSSVINGMVHIRGNPSNYDRWAQKGNEGWSYKELLPYFKKSEDYLVEIQDVGYHGHGGNLGVENPAYRSKAAEAFVQAMQELGYDYVDYNGRGQIGVSYIHGTTRRGRRCSAFNSFLEPVRNRTNLNIYTNARVTKVLIDDVKKAAYGVEYVKDNRLHVAKTNKEVILSAGALSSPQLLMLSGIGPKEHLRELNISLVQDLPVGQKLYDHLGFYGLTFTVNQSITITLNDVLQGLQPLVEYSRGKGVLTSLSSFEALGIIKTVVSDDPDPLYPDVELIFLGSSNHIDRGELFRKVLEINDEMYDALWKPLEGKHAFTILPLPFHPKSYGYMKLKSKNPYDRPKFYGNYFTDPENFDIKTFIAAIRVAQSLIKMPAFRKYDAKLVEIPVPGCEHYEYDGDPYWECALRHLSVTEHHQTTTCKMGPKSDPESVVGDTLKVHGIKRLRIADTSIIPEPIAAHTNVPAYMIGEKASDIIKRAWLGK